MPYPLRPATAASCALTSQGKSLNWPRPLKGPGIFPGTSRGEPYTVEDPVPSSLSLLEEESLTDLAVSYSPWSLCCTWVCAEEESLPPGVPLCE